MPPELGVDHFAAFPMEWPRRIIQGWSPAGVCTGCGEGRRPMAVKALAVLERGDIGSRGSKFNGSHDFHQHNRYGQDKVYGRTESTITGYACGCPEPTTPAVILDPFGGTGTTALVAKALGRLGISVDMSGDYSRLAEWRCNDPGQLAAAMGVEKPPEVPDDQMDLFDGEYDTTARPRRPSGLDISKALGPQHCHQCGHGMSRAGARCEKCGAQREVRA